MSGNDGEVAAGSAGYARRLARERSSNLIDPLRVGIIAALGVEPSTAGQVAARVGADPKKVRYLLRRMREVGLVEVLEGTPSRGSRENVYALDLSQLALADDDLAKLPESERDLGRFSHLRTVYRETMAGLEFEPEGAGEELLIGLPMPLDARGWGEASVLLHEVLEQTLAAWQRSFERLAASGEWPRERLAIILLFPLAENTVEQPPIAPGRAVGDASEGLRDLAPPRLPALFDPVRRAVMRDLLLRPRSARELAADLGIAVEKVRVQTRRLEAEGLIHVHTGRQTRGTMERVFGLDPRRAVAVRNALLGDDPQARRRFQRSVVAEVFREALAAVKAGAFKGLEDYVTAHIPLRVDERGDAETEELLGAAIERLFEIREQSLGRLEASGEVPFLATASVFKLETEPKGKIG